MKGDGLKFHTSAVSVRRFVGNYIRANATKVAHELAVGRAICEGLDPDKCDLSGEEEAITDHILTVAHELGASEDVPLTRKVESGPPRTNERREE